VLGVAQLAQATKHFGTASRIKTAGESESEEIAVGADDKGKPVNINADDAASAIAIRMKAEHLVFLTNIQGVKDQNKKTIRRLKIGAIEKLISSFVITGGMIPKVQSAKSAVLKGVGEVNIIDGSRGVRLDAGTAILR
jgi:acetylglutamate kinase